MNRTFMFYIYIMNTLDAPSTSETSFHDDEDLMRSGRRNRGRLHAILVCTIFIIYFVVYGLPSKYHEMENPEAAKHEIPFLILCTVFPVLGFGLLMSSYTYLKSTGMFLAFYVVCINFLIGPIIHQICFLAFAQGNTFVENGDKYLEMIGDNSITPTNLTFKLSNLCSISFLIALSGVLGRITIGGLFQIQLIFTFLWYVNLNINVFFIDVMQIKNLTYFDDYGTTFVFLFGACFGLPICIYNKTSRADNEIESDFPSSVYSLLGTAFLFCSFAFISTDIIQFTSQGVVYHLSLGVSSIWFSMIGSIIGVYCASFMVNGQKVGVRQASFGTVIGGVMSGAGAGFIENIGACLAIGFIAGFITAVVINTFVEYANHKDIVDSSGFIFPTLITSFLGTFTVFPIVILVHYNEGNDTQVYQQIGKKPGQVTQEALFQLMHCGFTIFISLFGSIFGALIVRSSKEQFSDFSDYKIFAFDSGLYLVEDEVDTSLNENEKSGDEEKQKKEQKSDKSAKADEI